MIIDKQKIDSVSTFEEFPTIEQLAAESKVLVTENQLKVMANKYLRGEPVEIWLRRIARNIALPDLLYEKDVSKEQILDGVHHQIIKDSEQNAVMLLLHSKESKRSERTENFRRFQNNLLKVAQSNLLATKIVRQTEEKFYRMISDFDFLPNSPCLMNAGRDLQQLHACFREDQPIMTANGVKPIIDIKEGELVLTASGKFRKVVKTMERFVESYRIINVWKMPNQTLAVSDDHPILCLNTKTNKSGWKFASEITAEDYVAVSYPKEVKDVEEINMLDFVDKSKFIVKDNLLYKLNKDNRSPEYNIQIKPIKAEVEIDYDLMRIFGYYLSEGDIDKNNAVRFTFNSSEISYMQDLIKLMENKFGVTSEIKKSNSGNWSNVRFFSRILVKMFKSTLGEGFNKKKIPNWILELPVEKQKGLLVGILRGDGYPAPNKNNTNIRAVLYNQDLVYGIWVVLARLGLLANFKKDKMSRLATTDPYRCQLDTYNSEKIFDEIFINKEFNGLTQLSMRRVKEKYIDGTFYLPVKDISVIMHPIKVYNFEVEEEHTYVANNIAVHNCYVIPIGDSMDEIYYAVTAMALIHQSGGGTGFSFSRLRPEGNPVQSTKGVASGPMSFIRIFDVSTDVVRQGGCVDLNTRVSTKEGLIKIGEIVPNNLTVNSWKQHSITVMTDSGPKLSDEAYNNGEAEVINLKTKQGYKVTATLEHRFRVINEDGEYVWKHLKDVKTGDWLALQLDSYTEETDYKLPEFNYKPHFNAEPIMLPEAATIGLGELIGYFVGDGAVSIDKRGTGRFILSFADEYPDTKDYVHNLMLNIFGILPTELKKKDDKSTNSFYNRTVLVHWMKNIGVDKKSSLSAYAPEIVFRSGREFAKGFLRGLFTADGTITDEGYISLASVSEKLIDDAQQLLLSLGIPSRKSVTENRESAFGDNPLYRLSVITERGAKIFSEEIGFLAEKKNKRLRSKEIKWEFNDIIPNQERKLKQIYNGPGRGCAPGKISKGANRRLYRDIQHYLPGIQAKRNLTYKRLKFLAEKHPEIKKSSLSWFLDNNQFYDQVEFLTKGKTYTVDLSVPENNTYIANGFVSHNTRRGANMGILHYKHPDIRKFITSKSKDKGFLQNFNISVALDANFIKAVEEDAEFELVNPKDNQVVGTESAREIFDLMAKCAWETGDPGFVVIDRINNSNSNPTPKLGPIESTNPCGEQPLLPWEPCTLGSINLSNHVKKLNGKHIVNYEKLEYTTKLATHFLDNVIDSSNYPLPEIELMSKGNRRIGLGVMGWAEMLIKLEIPYDSEEAIILGEEIMGFINQKSLEASEELAEKRGVYLNYKDSIYDENSKYFTGVNARPRNCARTTIAPTGTIAITAGLQGSGIEPFFAIAYKRFQAEAVDALKEGREPDERYVYYEVIPIFLDIAEENNWFGLGKKELLKRIVDNHGSVKGIKEIPERIRRAFTSSHDLHWKTHIDHQAAFQKHTDNAVSKTINMANTVTVEEVKSAYFYAYKAGCKGVTIYRDGSKDVQVLSSGSVKKQEKVDLSRGALSDYYEIQTGYGPLHINIVYDKVQGPYKIFTSLSPIGAELSSLVSALGVFMSKAFRAGYPPEKAIKHLNSIKGDKPLGFGPNRVDSIPHAISIALKRHLEKTGRVENKEQLKLTEINFEIKQQHCPKCYSPNIEYISGCSSPTCIDCGYSECS